MGLKKNPRHAAFNRLAMYNNTDLKRFEEALKAADVFFNECDKADYSYLDYMYYGHLLEELKKFPQIKEVRGRGLMIGLEFEEPIKELRSRLIYDEHVFTGASGTNVLRLLPPLCLSMEEADEFLARFKKVL